MQPLSPSDPPTVPLEEILIARLSHDLFNPLGAIANGIELLSLTEASPEMQLVQDSVTLATTRLRVFRGAFGPTSRAEGYTALEVRALFKELATLSRYRYYLESTAALSAVDFPLLCLGLLFGEGVLPLGGTLVFRQSSTGWQLDATGRKIRFDFEDLQPPLAASLRAYILFF